MKEERVILVNKKDRKIGTEEKLKAHIEGKLHRAVSVIVLNDNGEMLIQKRAKGKYHSGSLWSNACCSHPRPGENVFEAAKRRLKEELGFTCKLKKVFKFRYKVKLGNLIENEIDHVFLAKYNGKVTPNKKEVEDFKWVKVEDLLSDVKKNPEKYTFWFKKILKLRKKWHP